MLLLVGPWLERPPLPDIIPATPPWAENWGKNWELKYILLAAWRYQSQNFIFQKEAGKYFLIFENAERKILTVAWAAVERENWSDMDMDDMEEGGNMAPAWTITVKWSIMEYFWIAMKDFHWSHMTSQFFERI